MAEEYALKLKLKQEKAKEKQNCQKKIARIPKLGRKRKSQKNEKAKMEAELEKENRKNGRKEISSFLTRFQNFPILVAAGTAADSTTSEPFFRN